jgi:hypothetical protein
MAWTKTAKTQDREISTEGNKENKAGETRVAWAKAFSNFVPFVRFCDQCFPTSRDRQARPFAVFLAGGKKSQK